jgi:hypothetical protein
MIYEELSALFGAKLAPVQPPLLQTSPKCGSNVNNQNKRPASDAFQTAAAKKPKGGRKGLYESRKQRYLKEDYVSSLLLSSTLEAYDNGVKPICHSRCSRGCQRHFLQMKDGADFLRDLMLNWWGKM